MSVYTDQAFQRIASGGIYGLIVFIEAQFKVGVQRWTNFPLSIEALGQTWTGMGDLGEVGGIHESEDGQAEKMQAKLSVVKDENLVLGMGDPSSYQDRDIRLWFGVVDASTMELATPVLRFAGVMNTIELERADQSTDNQAKLVLNSTTDAYAARTNPAGLRMNNEQHQAAHPGERGFEMVAGLIGTPVDWLTKDQQRWLAR